MASSIDIQHDIDHLLRQRQDLMHETSDIRTQLQNLQMKFDDIQHHVKDFDSQIKHRQNDLSAEQKIEDEQRKKLQNAA